MEIKYTIEILTKDIQDIEKLVENLQNSKDGSSLELDLALSKLRNVYEILTMIKADRLHDLVSHSPVREESASEPTQKVMPEAATPERAPEPLIFIETAAEPEVTDKPEPESEPILNSEPSDPSILAEKFPKESSINAHLAGKRNVNLDSKLMGQPIENISRNIGINDRFFIIRELFQGNSDQFSNLVNRLDAAENYQEAKRILREQFPDSMDQEGVEILAGLIKRRHIH